MEENDEADRSSRRTSARVRGRRTEMEGFIVKADLLRKPVFDLFCFVASTVDCILISRRLVVIVRLDV